MGLEWTRSGHGRAHGVPTSAGRRRVSAEPDRWSARDDGHGTSEIRPHNDLIAHTVVDLAHPESHRILDSAHTLQPVKRPVSVSAHKAAHGLVMVCDVDLEVPDGTRTHTVEVAAGFAAEGLAVDLVARGPDPRLSGVRYHRAHGSEARRALRVTDLTLRTVALLCRRRRRARRCYVRHSWSNIPILIVARLLRYRLVTQVDDIQYGRGSRFGIPFAVDHAKRLAAMSMGRLAHGVVAVSPPIKELLVNQFRVPAERVAALSNGVDVDLIRPISRPEAIRRAGLDLNASYVLFCGRLESWGDFDTLLEAFALVHGWHPDARLVLVGDGPERKRIEERATELKIREMMVMTGFVEDRARVGDLMGAATVTLISYRDGFV